MFTYARLIIISYRNDQYFEQFSFYFWLWTYNIILLKITQSAQTLNCLALKIKKLKMSDSSIPNKKKSL